MPAIEDYAMLGNLQTAALACALPRLPARPLVSVRTRAQEWSTVADSTTNSAIAHLEGHSSRGMGVLRAMVLGAGIVLLVQTGIGMVVNLYVAIPSNHAGAHPANFLSGSFHSVVWALSHGALALAIHAALGVALVVMATTLAVFTIRLRLRAVAICCVLAALLIIGAGFNGASFLAFDLNANSLIMTVLALSALLCYFVAIAMLPPAA